MRAVRFNGYGGPEVTEIAEVPRPDAGPGQLLVRVAAAGVNPVDWKIRDGHMRDAIPFIFPVTLGNELAGTVEAVGFGVTGFAPGDRVFATTLPSGAFADYAAVDAAAAALAPSSVGLAEAAALPVAVVTATAALDAGDVGEGTKLLIHAAAGGVGSIALQLAKARGAIVTALASPANLDFVRDLGADHAVDRNGHYEDEIGGFDMVLDAFGPETTARSWGLLKPGGILVTLAAPPSPEEADARGVRATMIFGGPNATALAAAATLVDKGALKPSVSRAYPVEDALAAIAEVEGGKVRGKVVITF
ncbi:NADP-dependent oxidoreductase [Sphingobium aromaticiconvertens]|uniref:NADP-dependent oxidoreductase n=1 Tax=Sphingobium aromaticiconvertens TaxID=365341 RepID=UPI0030167686